jgi:hypothetical protein
MRKRKRKIKYRNRTYHSNFEVDVAKQLYTAKVKFTYETTSYYYEQPVAHGECLDCASKNVITPHWYTPDFFLSNGVIVESKGKLDRDTRKKLKAIKNSNPDLDLKILFMKDNKIRKGSKTTYTMWATSQGFDCAVKTLKKEWLE